MLHGEAGWWNERFNVADIDHNGLLNFTELREYKLIDHFFFSLFYAVFNIYLWVTSC